MLTTDQQAFIRTNAANMTAKELADAIGTYVQKINSYTRHHKISTKPADKRNNKPNPLPPETKYFDVNRYLGDALYITTQHP